MREVQVRIIEEQQEEITYQPVTDEMLIKAYMDRYYKKPEQQDVKDKDGYYVKQTSGEIKDLGITMNITIRSDMKI